MKTTTAFWKRLLPYAGAGVAVLLLAGFLSSCSVTTSPDDSTLAPALGTSLIFEEYSLDLKDGAAMPARQHSSGFILSLPRD